jgi:hypothetical protein
MTIRRLSGQIKITSDDGMMLRCGEVTAKKVYMPLGGDPAEWTEEPETEQV